MAFSRGIAFDQIAVQFCWLQQVTRLGRVLVLVAFASQMRLLSSIDRWAVSTAEQYRPLSSIDRW